MPELRLWLPEPPFDDWAIQERHDFGLLWVCAEPRAVVTQVHIPEVSEAHINTFHDRLDAFADMGFASRGEPCVLLHDWRKVKQVDKGIRKLWLDRAKRPDNPYAGARTYAAVDIAAIYRVMLNTVALAMQMTASQSVQIIEDPREALTSEKIGPPPVDALDRALRG
ncbi:MAG: hypothetical protein AB8I08_21125 [Sandaracinaceae bacterium]